MPSSPTCSVPLLDELSEMRQVGLEAGTSPWVVFMTAGDIVDTDFVETLVRAQQASGADVVSCELFTQEADGRRTLLLFPGEPRSLGLLENGYGTVALLVRSLLDNLTMSWPVEKGADWPLLASLSQSRAEIVSVPRPLLTSEARLADVGGPASDVLLAIQLFEHLLPSARLAAGRAADSRSTRPATNGNLARRRGRVARDAHLRIFRRALRDRSRP